MEDQNQKSELNFIKVLRFLFRWRYSLIIVTVVAGIAGAVFSAPFFVTPLYKSEANFYAGTSHSVSRILLERTDLTREDILEFGEEEHAERMLQILQSDYIRDIIIERFELMGHYGLEPDTRYVRTKLEDIYFSRISSTRTPYASVVIQVKDADPELAAEIANTMMYMADTLKEKIQRPRATDIRDIVKRQYENKKKDVLTLIDSLHTMAENVEWRGIMGMYGGGDYLRQLDEMRYELTQDAMVSAAGLDSWTGFVHPATQARPPQRRSNEGTLVPLLHEYGPGFYAVSNALALEIESLSYLRERLEHAEIDLNEHMSNLYVVDEARPAERPASPVRSLVVIGSLLSAFVMTCIVLLVVENARYIIKVVRE